MSNENIIIEQKNNSGTYDSIYPATSAAMVKYSNAALGSGVTNVEEALVAIKNLYGSDLPTTSYDKITTGLRKTQLTKKNSDGIYEPIRIETTAEQVPIYSPTNGQLTNLKLLLDSMVLTNNCLRFTANEANATISMSVMGSPRRGQNFQYTTDMLTWNTFTPGTTTVTLSNVGDIVYFRGNNPNGVNESISIYHYFVISGSVAAGGNVMSLIDNGSNDVFEIPNLHCFFSLFQNCTTLTTAPLLPATILKGACYGLMFKGCTSLTTPPELPATTLAGSCYSNMFEDCTGLTSAPELPATTLANYCYDYMFKDCTSLYVSDSSGMGYDKAWTIPTSGTFTNTYAQTDMFANCLGTRSSDSMAGAAGASYTYYTQNEPV